MAAALELAELVDRLEVLERRMRSTSANGQSFARQITALQNRALALGDDLIHGDDRAGVERRITRMAEQIEALELAQKLDALQSLPSSVARPRDVPSTMPRPSTRLFTEPLVARPGFVTPSGPTGAAANDTHPFRSEQPETRPTASERGTSWPEAAHPSITPPNARSTCAPTTDSGAARSDERLFSAKQRYEELRAVSRAAALLSRPATYSEPSVKTRRIVLAPASAGSESARPVPHPPHEPLTARPAPRPAVRSAARPEPMAVGNTPTLVHAAVRESATPQLCESSRPPIRESAQPPRPDVATAGGSSEGAWAVDIPEGRADDAEARQSLRGDTPASDLAEADEEDTSSARASSLKGSKKVRRIGRRGSKATTAHSATGRSRVRLIVACALLVLLATLAVVIALIVVHVSHGKPAHNEQVHVPAVGGGHAVGDEAGAGSNGADAPILAARVQSAPSNGARAPTAPADSFGDLELPDRETRIMPTGLPSSHHRAHGGRHDSIALHEREDQRAHQR
ncbi:hypothetical protein KFE25_006090 [Diacronema lutheri]|uniref:Uncharacterized protein n=2 Tax=Diacronema lutheri TaxID=2081491 RepID=A0A8J5XXA3_DIALT|nr:hypothetical protein KFE25_006090 [Diacronema lutheri]